MSHNGAADDLTAKCHYDRIVMTAAEKGLVQDFNDTSRGEFRQRFMAYHKQLGLSADDFPLVCPSNDELEELLDLSLAFEKKLLPDFYSRAGEEAKHRAAFWKKVKAKDFCHVNVDRVLDGKSSWQEVLESLRLIEK